jgi:hypothetical protein
LKVERRDDRPLFGIVFSPFYHYCSACIIIVGFAQGMPRAGGRQQPLFIAHEVMPSKTTEIANMQA